VPTLWGGEAPSELLGLPLASQIPRVNELIMRIDADPDGFGLPKERVEEVREANARLEAAYKAERASRAAWSFQSKAAEEAEDAFRAAYRAPVKIIVATHGEVAATQWLPTFERKPRAKKAATE
jgi:phosphoglycolate phosphatase-like HAD superfamily hydrolase